VVNCDEVFLEWHSPHAFAPAKSAKGTVPFVGHQRWLFTRSRVVLGVSKEGGDWPGTAIPANKNAASALTAMMGCNRARPVHDLAGGFHADLFIARSQLNKNAIRLKNVSTLPEQRRLRKVYFAFGVRRFRL
jgi:hypothetical protein